VRIHLCVWSKTRVNHVKYRSAPILGVGPLRFGIVWREDWEWAAAAFALGRGCGCFLESKVGKWRQLKTRYILSCHVDMCVLFVESLLLPKWYVGLDVDIFMKQAGIATHFRVAAVGRWRPCTCETFCEQRSRKLDCVYG